MNLHQILRETDLKINISDIGLDLVFSNTLLSLGNLSRVIENINCNNNNDITVKAVSLDNVSRRIELMRGIYGSHGNVVHIAISGANYATEKKSHAWIGFGIKNNTRHFDVFYHVTIPYEPSAMDRARVNDYFANVFMNLLFEYIHNNKISPKTLKAMGVDAVYDQRYSLEELTEFVKEKAIGIISVKSLGHYFVNRTEDILRESFYIYRGSFNPVTRFHQSIISGYSAMPELTTNHFEKDEKSLLPIHHRVRMLLEYSKNILISNCSKFQDLDNALMQYTDLNPMYIVGPDVYDKIDPNDPVIKRITKIDPVHNMNKDCRASDYRKTNNDKLVSEFVHEYINKRLGFFDAKNN